MCQYSSIVCQFLIIQLGQTKRPTPALSQVTPNNVLELPCYIVRGYPIHCLLTAPHLGAMWIHCTHITPHLGGSADIVPELPRAVRRQCLCSAPGSAETLYGVPPNNVPGQPQTLLGVTRDNAEVACFVWPPELGIIHYIHVQMHSCF